MHSSVLARKLRSYLVPKFGSCIAMSWCDGNCLADTDCIWCKYSCSRLVSSKYVSIFAWSPRFGTANFISDIRYPTPVDSGTTDVCWRCLQKKRQICVQICWFVCKYVNFFCNVTSSCKIYTNVCFLPPRNTVVWLKTTTSFLLRTRPAKICEQIWWFVSKCCFFFTIWPALEKFA